MSDPQPPVSRRSLLGGSLGLLALGALPVLAACDPRSSAAPPVVAPSTGTPTITAPPVAAAPPLGAGLQVLPVSVIRAKVRVADAPDLPAVVDGMRSFGAHLHAAAASSTANWTASPLSIVVASGMLRAGSLGRTATQIDTVFGFPSSAVPAGSPHAALNALTAALVTTRPVSTARAHDSSDGEQPRPIVAMANGLFPAIAEVARIEPAFLQLLAAQYGTSVTPVDYTKSSAEKQLNEWVADQTRGRIKKLFDEIDPSTALVIANAVYFKGAWSSTFEKSETVSRAFTTPSGRVTAHTMAQSFESATYGHGADWQRVSLPYAREQLEMRVVLPRAVVGDVATLTRMVGVAMASNTGDDLRSVDVRLPRWDTGTSIDLTQVLTKLGMTDAFDPARANLNGIENGAGLYVDQAIHRANITVDEAGTEAAAVTAYGAVAMSAESSVPPPIDFYVDRPFAWAIVHRATGTPLFAGHVVDPTATA